MKKEIFKDVKGFENEYKISNFGKIVSKNMSRGSSDFIGVYWYSPNKKWTAKILINKKRYYLGLFKTENEANLFYQEALKEKYFAEKVDNFRIFIKNKLKK